MMDYYYRFGERNEARDGILYVSVYELAIANTYFRKKEKHYT